MVRIVVVGAGKLGYSIAELLSKEAFDVVTRTARAPSR